MTSSAVLPQTGDIVGDKYRIEQLLGSGGMGAVFEATHQVTGKRFAIKWLLPSLAGEKDATERFIREAQVAGRFQHPNVVEVYDIAQQGDSFYMVMELLEGESLMARLNHVGRMTPATACSMMLPCLRGVARAHAAGIVHRDLKPANIFVCRATAETPERPKVLDFGISKMSSMGGFDASMTKSGVVMGTPHYMPPEQLRGHAIDHRVDVYACGVILYQLLSGKVPFDATSMVDLVLRIVVEVPEPLQKLAPDVPIALADIVSRAMARDPDARFETLEALVTALEPFATGAHDPGSPATKGATSPLDPVQSERPLDTPFTTTSRTDFPLPKRARGLTALAVVLGIGVLVAIARIFLPSGSTAALQTERAPGSVTSAASSQPSAPSVTAIAPPPASAPQTAPSPPLPIPRQAGADGWITPPLPAAPPAPRTERLPKRPRSVAVSRAPTESVAKKTVQAPDAQKPPSVRPPQATDPTTRKAGRLGVEMDPGEF